ERRVPAVGLVQRREAHEPVLAALGLQDTVGVLALDGERGRLEARLLARARLEELGLEAALLGPAQVRAEQHLGEVLRVGAARVGLDRDDRVARVVLAAEERVLLEPFQLGAGLRGRWLQRRVAQLGHAAGCYLRRRIRRSTARSRRSGSDGSRRPRPSHTARA